MKVDFKKLMNVFYTALMIFLVFTFAWKLLQGLINNFNIDFVLYTLMWLFLVMQTTFAYVHIMKITPEDYTISAFISDCTDIGIAIYVCAAIGSTYNDNAYTELAHYQHISIPFIILAINQFSWFVMVKEYNVPAIFRINILFWGMSAVTISESLHHSFWNLVAIVALIVLLGILRAINKAPYSFNWIAKKLWGFVK